MAISRRYFLKSGAVALAGCAATPSFLVRTALAQENRAPGKDHPIIIAIFQRGAADGISMVVPFGDRYYAAARPQIAIPEPMRGADERAIDLDGFFGLHPSLSSLKPIYDQGHLAIVHAAGSPDTTRSHFDAQDYMESGAPGNKGVSDGWLNRYLQVSPEPDASAFRAVALTPALPRSLAGPAAAVSMQRVASFGIHGGKASPELEEMFADLYKDTFDAVKTLRSATQQQYTPTAGVQYPNTPFAQSLQQIAQLIKSNVGVEVAFAEVNGWDTHANQGSSRGRLANDLKSFGDALAALYRDLGDQMRNVVIVTMTEFGRAMRQNGSGGTDHGHASCLFVAGGPVKGGKVYGRWPGLAPEQLYEGRDLALTTDFRNVFSEILVKHMRTPDTARVFPNFKPAAGLQIL
ncbi:MAG TPA: DUF1501 domain-containing protein [Terriglobia bacterium]|jgi:uncharacterized protein (DUF1501 family)